MRTLWFKKLTSKSQLVFICFLFSFSAFSKSPLDQIPIQDRGRVKPFQSFSQEMMQLIHGRKTMSAKESNQKSYSSKLKRETSEVIMTFMLAPEQWEETKIVRIDRLDLKKALGFSETQKFFSINEVLKTSSLQSLLQKVSNKSENKEKLNPFDQAVQKLESQLSYVRLLQMGEAMKLVPPKTGETWRSVNEMEGPLKEQFGQMLAVLVRSISSKMNAENSAESQKSQQELLTEVNNFIALARAENPEIYPSAKIIAYELSYNNLKPFQWAWLSYFFAFLMMLLYWVFSKNYFPKISWALTFVGLSFHIYGFVIRTLISGRAPVTNMYETVVWVPLGAIIFGIIIEYTNKNKFTLMAANLGAFLCLLLADMAPSVLDPTIQPLEAVLRSNFWLSTHVTTIVISYSAFFLAFVLGDINLFYFATDPKKWAKKIKTINDSIYKAIQIGVLLLAIGIVLGGVWADYSWGRFWGWDPKETWALIALLGYIAVLHARLVGWVKQFGMAAMAVASFSLVIMAWYGVNYVLGAGLHSYGFGAGGVEYVTAFVMIHFLLIGLVWIIKSKKLQD